MSKQDTTTTEYEFSAYIVVEALPSESKQQAAYRILEHMLEADFSCSLHNKEMLSVKSNVGGNTKFIRMEAVMERYDVPRSTLDGWIEQGTFPPGIYVGGGETSGARRWSLAELDAYDERCAVTTSMRTATSREFKPGGRIQVRCDDTFFDELVEQVETRELLSGMRSRITGKKT